MYRWSTTMMMQLISSVGTFWSCSTKTKREERRRENKKIKSKNRKSREIVPKTRQVCQCFCSDLKIFPLVDVVRPNKNGKKNKGDVDVVFSLSISRFLLHLHLRRISTLIELQSLVSRFFSSLARDIEHMSLIVRTRTCVRSMRLVRTCVVCLSQPLASLSPL